MKYLVKISNRALSHRFIFASLVSLNFVLLILLLAGSCKKEVLQANNILPLTIGDAKLIYATLHSDYTPSDAVQRDDSTEAGHNTPLVIPDWEKAETYLDEKRQISVVEVPVVTHHIAKLVIVEGTADSSAVDGTTQLNKLVFTQDTSGAIRFALMKLVGTPGYLATHDITLNSFRHLDLDFQGFLGYYNLRDSLLKAFLFNEQDIFEVQSQPGNPGNGVQNAQDRWGYCIDHYEYRPCTSNQEHTWEQREQCKCGTEAAPNCTPPQRVPIYVICGVEVYLQGHIDEHGILPPRLPDNSLWITVGNGGGTVGGNTNQLSCLANAAKNFKDKYGLDLFSEAYEDILYGCMANIDCHENEQVAFEECVKEEIIELFDEKNQKIDLTEQEKNWFKSHFDFFAKFNDLVKRYPQIDGTRLLHIYIRDIENLVYTEALPIGTVFQGEEGTGETFIYPPNPEEFPDCSSWIFTNVAGGDYQVAGVSNLTMDMAYLYMDEHSNIEVGIFVLTLGTHYFELPRISFDGSFISPGRAADQCALIWEIVEGGMETNDSKPRNNAQYILLESKIINAVKNNMLIFGGRFTKENYYNVGTNIYNKSIFPTNCN